MDSNSVCLPNVRGSLSNVYDEAPLAYGLHKFLSSFSHYCITTSFFPEVMHALCGMSPIWKAHDEIHDLSVDPLGHRGLTNMRENQPCKNM